MRIKGCVGSENAKQSALGTLKSDLIPTSQRRFGEKSAYHLSMTHKVQLDVIQALHDVIIISNWFESTSF